MRNRKQNGANIKNTPKMPLRSHKTINQEGNNTLSTSNLQKSQWKIKLIKLMKNEMKMKNHLWILLEKQ